ncbi:MAG: CBS domain-containing protein [Candidatus Bathyarchaeia archaeon]
MLPELEEIAQKRKMLQLTQSELARLAGVSRSWIAKVETAPEKLMPSYALVKRVFDVLEMECKARSLKAKSWQALTVGDVHSVGVEYAWVDESLEAAWRRMAQKCLSQLPVKNGDQIVGSLTEKGVNRKIFCGEYQDLRQLKVRDAMEQPFPIVSVVTPLFAVIDLLQVYQAVLTHDGLEIAGIVTNIDIAKAFKHA